MPGRGRNQNSNPLPAHLQETNHKETSQSKPADDKSSLADEIKELESQIPKLEPEALKRFFEHFDEYIEFLANKDGEESLATSAKAETLVENLCLWLYDIAQRSIDPIEDKIIYNNEGVPIPFSMVEETLKVYEDVAHNILLYAVPPPTPEKLLQYRNTISRYTPRIVRHFQLKKAKSLSGSIKLDEVLEILKPFIEKSKSESGMANDESSQTLYHLDKILDPDHISPLTKLSDPPLIPTVEQCEGDESELYLVNRFKELEPYIPKGLYSKDGKMTLDLEVFLKASLGIEESSDLPQEVKDIIQLLH
ncbi:uncharacterized protein L201_003049 [Kwoniella dendrophila CBS 6074]|uniref:Uncharacterized protein n=1 Tax=Kwoniella dendrophila CBS 6074 TaxID=1295534 RepID=A0AAX4JTB0_9TREE